LQPVNRGGVSFFMRKVILILLSAAAGGGLVFGCFHLHVVRSAEGWHLVRKQHLDWRDAYVDVRGWGFREWNAHPQLSRNLAAAGRGDLVGKGAASQIFRGMFDAFRNSGSRELEGGHR
jgi:hypothetical protein